MFKVVRDYSDLRMETVTSVPEREKFHIRLEQDERDNKQIVQTEDSTSDKNPEDAKFLSERDQYFEKETVAENVGAFQEAGKGQDVQEVDRSQIAAMETERKEISWDELALTSETGTREIAHEVREEVFQRESRGSENGDETLRGIAQNNDFVEEIPLGDFTRLNTVEYKYYGFYHRIRQQLEQYWGNSIEKKARELYSREGRMPASSHIITSLEVTINEMGQIIEIIVKSPSGVQAFDDAAIESFSKAGPFPNPPRGLLKNGRAVISWGFVVNG